MCRRAAIDAQMATASRSLTCPRATRFFSHSRWRGPRCLRANDIVIGVNALDYSGLSRLPPGFIEAFETMANLATKTGVEGRTRMKTHAPLIELSKADIVRLAADLGVPFGLTHSCYDPDASGRPCGACDSCLLRSKGFREAGIATRRCGSLRFSIRCRAKAGSWACRRSSSARAAAICDARGATRRIRRGIRKARNSRLTHCGACGGVHGCAPCRADGG